MSTFEFFMAFYGVLLGLAMTELLSGFGGLLRLRERPRWGYLTPLAGGCVLIMVVTAFADAWISLQQVSIDMRGLTAPMLNAMALFVAALMVVPRDLAEWPDLDTYFMVRRRLILLPLIGGIATTVFGFELPAMVRTHIAPSVPYVIANLLIVGLLTVAATSRRPRVAAAAMAMFLLVMFAAYFAGITIKDAYDLIVGNPPMVRAGPPAPS